MSAQPVFIFYMRCLYRRIDGYLLSNWNDAFSVEAFGYTQEEAISNVGAALTKPDHGYKYVFTVDKAEQVSMPPKPSD